MHGGEWDNFLELIKAGKLPKGCSLEAVQAQLYQYYKAHCITTAQWTEFETHIHRLEPTLPWRSKSASEMRG